MEKQLSRQLEIELAESKMKNELLKEQLKQKTKIDSKDCQQEQISVKSDYKKLEKKFS